MKNLFKNFLLASMLPFFGSLGNKASILMYHSVGTDGHSFSVTPATFEKQMQYLREKKFNIIPLSELVSRMKNKQSIANRVSVTFDDGYKDNYTNAFPILKKYSIPCTIFLITGEIGKSIMIPNVTLRPQPMLSVTELREMSESPLVEFMPHSVTHRPFSRIVFDEAKKEISDSTKAIKQMFGNRSGRIFSFPRGRFSPEISEYMRIGGFWDAAVTVNEGLISPQDDLYTLKRNAIDGSLSFAHFRAKVSGALEVYLKLKRFF